MNFHAQVAIDAIRCCSIAAAAFAIGWPLGGVRRTRLGWICLLAPLLTPSLLISYAAAPLALQLTGPWLVLFYSAVLTLKLAPLAALARDFFPPSLTAEAIHCELLVPGRSAASRAFFAIRAAGPAPWAIFGVIFLLAFTDFELASLLSIKTWAVMLFDAHAGGLALSQALQRLAWPVAIEMFALLVVAFCLRQRGAQPVGSTLAGSPRPPQISLVMVALLICGLPLARIVMLAATGLSQLRFQFVLVEDLFASLVVAMTSGVFVWLWVRAIHRPVTRFLLAVPGLLGALTLALMILNILELRRPALFGFGPPMSAWRLAMNGLRETPAPLIVANILLLLPVALVLRQMIKATRPAEALHLARMAGSRVLIWDMAMRQHFAAFSLLFLLAYFEFTAASILAPLGMTPVFARLHNLAHYGQTAVLSAMLLCAFAAPAALLALTVGAARLYARRQ